MEIKINKEVRSYTESIFFGLSPRQFIYSILACLVAVVIYFLTINTLGTETTSWLCMLGAAPFASIGFITYQSMTQENSKVFDSLNSQAINHIIHIGLLLKGSIFIIRRYHENTKKTNMYSI